MRISKIELREIRLPLIHFFETSFGRTTERRIILPRVRDQSGAEGWGECTCGEGPFYINVKRIKQLTTRKETISS